MGCGCDFHLISLFSGLFSRSNIEAYRFLRLSLVLVCSSCFRTTLLLVEFSGFFGLLSQWIEFLALLQSELTDENFLSQINRSINLKHTKKGLCKFLSSFESIWIISISRVIHLEFYWHKAVNRILFMIYMLVMLVRG